MSVSLHPTLLFQATTIEDIIEFIPHQHPLNHPDVIQVGGGEETISIEVVRQLQAAILQKPYQADFVIFILNRVDQATIEAQQALLKMLEEPPGHIQFMLLVEYPSLLLPTILSRVTAVQTHKKTEELKVDTLHQLQQKTVAERLQWAGGFSKLEETSRQIFSLIQSATEYMEQMPSLKAVETVRILQHTFELIQKRVNPRLSMEWFVLHLPE